MFAQNSLISFLSYFTIGILIVPVEADFSQPNHLINSTASQVIPLHREFHNSAKFHSMTSIEETQIDAYLTADRISIPSGGTAVITEIAQVW